MAGPKFELKDHRIPLERSHERGWGKVSIPADANPADNDFWFVFDEPPPRQTLIVADDPQAARPLQLAAAISPDPAVHVLGGGRSRRASSRRSSGRASRSSSGRPPCPRATRRRLVQAFVDRGGQVIFFPPRAPGDAEFLGVRWTAWVEEQPEVPVETGGATRTCSPTPRAARRCRSGKLQVRKYCGLAGEFTPLATLQGGEPLARPGADESRRRLLLRDHARRGDSSLATDGVVLYVLVQRPLAAGAAVLGKTRQLVAGDPAGEDAGDLEAGRRGAEARSRPTTRFIAASTAAGDRLLAVNRRPPEDQAAGPGRRSRGRAVPGARLRPGRRPGGQLSA